MLIMTSIIRIGQSKFVTVQIDEDSSERIMNCIQTLSGLQTEPAVHDVFLDDTKTAYTKMLGAQEVAAFSLSTGALSHLRFTNRNAPPRRKRQRLRRPLLFKSMTSCLSANSRRRQPMRLST
jgi:vesicle coat complex subunit